MTLLIAAALVCQVISTPAGQWGGVVIDRDSHAGIAGAQVTVVGERAVARTDATGHFRWTATLPPAPMTIIVILADGHVARPIRLAAVQPSEDTLLLAGPAIAEGVTIAGVAPAIDSAPGASSTFVPRADLEMRAPATLAQALENVPGVSALGEGQGAVPAIRGLARGRSLIMVDGSRVSTERRAGPNASFLDPSTVSSMEVARGPGSVAYGSDAFGGVIAVRTRRPVRNSPLTANVSAAIGAGVPMARGDVEVSRGYGSGGLLVSVRARTFDDYISPGGVVPNSAWHDSGVHALWEHEAGSHAWTAGWQSDFGRDIGRPRSDAATMRTTTPYEDSHRLTLAYEGRPAGWFEHLRIAGAIGASNERTEQERLATPKQPRNLTRADTSFRDQQLRVIGDRVLGGVRVQAGVDLQGRSGLEATDTTVAFNLAGEITSAQVTPSIASAHRYGVGVFGQADAQVMPRLRLSGGVRYDAVHNTNAGGYFGDRRVANDAVAGLAGATLTVAPRTTVTAQIARGFRDPTLSDRFYRGPVGRGFIEGNPDLQPETSRQADLTVRWDAGRLRLSGAYSEYRIANLVERYAVGSTSFFFRNRGAAALRGAEIEAQAGLPLGIAMSIGAQLSRGQDADTGVPIDDVAPRSISLIVRHTAARRLDSYLRVAAFDRHDAAGPSEVPTPGYVAMDAGATWHWTARLQVRALARNLLDQRFFSSAGARWVEAPGRHASITVAAGF